MPKHYKQFTDKENDGLNTAKFMRMFQEKVREMKSNKKSQEYKDMIEEEKIKGGVNVDTDSMMSQGLSSDTARDLLAMDKFSARDKDLSNNMIEALGVIDPKMKFRPTMLDKNYEGYENYEGPFRSYKDRLEKASQRSFRGNLAQSLMKHKFPNDLSALLGQTEAEKREQFPIRENLAQSVMKDGSPNSKEEELEQKNFMEKFYDSIQTGGILPTIGGALEKGGHSFLDLMIGGEGGRRNVPDESQVQTNYSEKVNITPQNMQKTIADTSNAMGISNPDWLSNVINFESGYDTKAINPTSGASGLIQFMPTTAKGMGTTVEDIRKMNTDDQMKLVNQYLNPYKGKMKTQEDVAMSVFYPAAIGNPDFKFPQQVVDQNHGIKTPREYVAKMMAKANSTTKDVTVAPSPSTREETSDEANKRLGLLGRVDLQFGDLIRSVFGTPSEQPNNASSAPVSNNNDNGSYPGSNLVEPIVPGEPAKVVGGLSSSDGEFVDDNLSKSFADIVAVQQKQRMTRGMYSDEWILPKTKPDLSRKTGSIGADLYTTLSGMKPSQQEFNEILDSLSYQQLQEKNKEREFINQVFNRKY